MILDRFFNRQTFGLAAVALFALNVFGISLGDHDLFLGLGFLAAGNVLSESK